MQPDQISSNLVAFRLQQARECLQTAEVDIAAGLFKAAANRSYYCVFHAMRAVLALDRFDSKKHSGVISTFRKNYVKTGVFTADISDIIKTAFEVRNNSDYQDFYLISKDEVAAQIENAKTFLATVEEYLAPKIKIYAVS